MAKRIPPGFDTPRTPDQKLKDFELSLARAGVKEKDRKLLLADAREALSLCPQAELYVRASGDLGLIGAGATYGLELAPDGPRQSASDDGFWTKRIVRVQPIGSPPSSAPAQMASHRFTDLLADLERQWQKQVATYGEIIRVPSPPGTLCQERNPACLFLSFYLPTLRKQMAGVEESLSTPAARDQLQSALQNAFALGFAHCNHLLARFRKWSRKGRDFDHHDRKSKLPALIRKTAAMNPKDEHHSRTQYAKKIAVMISASTGKACRSRTVYDILFASPPSR